VQLTSNGVKVALRSGQTVNSAPDESGTVKSEQFVTEKAGQSTTEAEDDSAIIEEDLPPE
jgi:hypothetical protein